MTRRPLSPDPYREAVASFVNTLADRREIRAALRRAVCSFDHLAAERHRHALDVYTEAALLELRELRAMREAARAPLAAAE